MIYQWNDMFDFVDDIIIIVIVQIINNNFLSRQLQW